MKRTILIAIGVLIAGPALAAQIVALGASNTEGRGRGRTSDGVPRAQAWPAQLQQMLRAGGCRANVRNAGVAGDTTAGMLRRLPGVFGRDTKVLILQPGGNDARRGVSGRAENIAAIENFASQHGAVVITLERLGAIASGHRLPDGQHFDAQGHAAFASYLLPQVMSAGVCK